jgi:hypothetical protein
VKVRHALASRAFERRALLVAALLMGCSPRPTTLLLDIDAAAGLAVQSLTLHIDVAGGGSQTTALPASGTTLTLPGRVIVKFPDAAVDVAVALDGKTAAGDPLHAETTVRTIPHAEVKAALTLGEGGFDAATGAPDGGDLGCTLGAGGCRFTYRRALTITNGSASPLPAGYTVRVPLDPALFAAGTVRADLNDVRLFGDAGDGERDRVVDLAPPGQLRALWFALPRAIAAGAADASYTVYYGDAAAGAPPADANRVFALWDGFDIGATPVNPPWQLNGTPSIAGGNLTLHKNSMDAIATAAASDRVPTLSALEWRARVTDFTSAGQLVGTDTFWHWIGYQRTGDFTAAAPWIIWALRSPTDMHGERKVLTGAACSTACQGGAVVPDNAFHWYRIERDATVTRYYRDGVLGYMVADGNDVDYSVLARNYAVSSDLLIDWIRARGLVSPEPTVAVGGEELVP